MVLNKAILLSFRSSIPCSSLFMIKFSVFFLAITPFASSLNFSLTNIEPHNLNTDIKIEGTGAYISNQGIQITPDEIGTDRRLKAGRATYIRPFHLWDSASGQLANFSTQFTFVIDSKGNRSYAEGLSFFLAHNNSAIITGGSIGLPVNSTTNIARDKFIAVEFDTFDNAGWDPIIGDHVGININSLTSVAYTEWFSNIPNGAVNQAWINYDSVSKKTECFFTGIFPNNTKVVQSISYTVDLRNELPERVIFGFTAATGTLFEKNNVISWSFQSSDLQINENNREPTGSPSPQKGENKKSFVVGL